MDSNAQGRGANLLVGQIFPKNCMKMKEIGPRGHVIGTSPNITEEIIALSAVQSFPRLLIHNAILFINTSTMIGTREVIG